MSDLFIVHDGSAMPVHPDAIVRPKYRGPEDESLGVRIRLAPACRLAWHHDGEDDDIVGYRVEGMMRSPSPVCSRGVL